MLRSEGHGFSIGDHAKSHHRQKPRLAFGGMQNLAGLEGLRDEEERGALMLASRFVIGSLALCPWI